MKVLERLLLSATTLILLTGCNTQAEKSLYIASKPYKTEYNVGENFSLEGLKVIDSKSGETITGYTSSVLDGYEFIESDINNIKSVTISKKGYNPASFEISVSNLPQLVISSYPKTEYIVGDYFSLEGLVVTANNEVVTGYSCNFSTSNKLENVGTFEVIISKTGYWPVSYNIEVSNIHTLTIVNRPNKTEYKTGEEFSSEGLLVHDEKGQVVSGYSLSIEDGTVLKIEGDITVTVSKETYESTSFTINVTKDSGHHEETDRDITIYYINDTHGSFARIEKRSEAGMSYVGEYIINKVNEDPSNSIVLSGGDMFQGGYESNETRGAIMIDAMNIINFDAMVLGNHEFDWGESYIESFDEKLDCPIISSNTFYSYDNVTRPDWVTPYAITEKDDLKIGIIGAARENMGSSIEGEISRDFYFPAPNAYIKQYSDELRLNKGCDVVIAAFHDEGFEGYNGSPTRYSDLTQVSDVTNHKYVDAMFFAHDHMRKEGKYNDVPYLEAGCNGKNVGELTLSLKGDGLSYTVTDSSTNIVWADSTCITSNEQIDALSNKEEYAEIIALASVPICTFSKSYTEEEFTVIACMAMYWYVNENKDQFGGVAVYLASHNTGGVRDKVDSGVFTRRDLIKAFPFDNQLSIQTCTEYNISRLKSSDYYRTYEEGAPVYDSEGHTHAVTITYISEYKYADRYYQVSHINYDFTAKQALIEYLIQGVNPDL